MSLDPKVVVLGIPTDSENKSLKMASTDYLSESPEVTEVARVSGTCWRG